MTLDRVLLGEAAFHEGPTTPVAPSPAAGTTVPAGLGLGPGDVFAALYGAGAPVLADNGGFVQTAALAGAAGNPALAATNDGDLRCATTTADVVNDSDGAVSLREAPAHANDQSGRAFVYFDAKRWAGARGSPRWTRRAPAAWRTTSFCASAPPPPGNAIGEVVEISVGTSWQSIKFANSHADAEVFALAPSRDEVESAATRLPASTPRAARSNCTKPRS